MSDQNSWLPQTAAELASLATLSPLVIGARLTEFWMSAALSGTTDSREGRRMVTEKYRALGESVIAMNIAAAQSLTAASLAVATGRVRMVNDADAILHAGLLPYSSRVRANRKRLARR